MPNTKLIVVLGWVGLLTACTSDAGNPSTPTSSAAAAATSSASAAWPNTDLPGTDCGTFVHEQGERSSPAAAQCIADAVRAKQPAHLIETAPTVEGAPITTYSLTDTRGRTSVIVDARKDVDGYPRNWPRDHLDNLNLGPVTITTCTRTCGPMVYLWPQRSRSYRSVNYEALNLLAVDRDCGATSPYVDRPDLQGLSAARAEAIEQVARRSVRVIGQDGTCNDRTDDLRADRTNIYVENGKVAWAQMG